MLDSALVQHCCGNYLPALTYQAEKFDQFTVVLELNVVLSIQIVLSTACPGLAHGFAALKAESVMLSEW